MTMIPKLWTSLKLNCCRWVQVLCRCSKTSGTHSTVPSINKKFDRIRLDIWLELRYDYSAYEKIKIINHVLYNVHGFKGNTDQYHDPSNSFINNVLESKRGNPIMLAVVYMLIAQRLNMPIYGVNLPQHFVLGYKELPASL